MGGAKDKQKEGGGGGWIVFKYKRSEEVQMVWTVRASNPSKLRYYEEAKARNQDGLLFPTKPKDQDAKKATAGEEKPQVSTVVLKVRLDCEGCIETMRKTAKKFKGVESVSIDAGKDLVTVKGTMDAKALTGDLGKKLKRRVEIVPPKKDGDNGGKKKDAGVYIKG